MANPEVRRLWGLLAALAVLIGGLLVAAIALLPASPGPLLTGGEQVEADTHTGVDPREGTVERVIDGDTVDVWRQGETIRVRLIGIDTPESVDPRKGVECFGVEAGDYLRNLLGQQKIVLEYDDTQGQVDKYGRTLAYLLLPDGTNVAEQMLQDGYAYEYTYRWPYRYQSAFQGAEAEARETQIGLWSSDTCGGNR
jgi:micrococcal nuclease